MWSLINGCVLSTLNKVKLMQCACICVQDGAPMGEDESYSAENLRRIARSLSGTSIGGQADSIPPSRSFVGASHNSQLPGRKCLILCTQNTLAPFDLHVK